MVRGGFASLLVTNGNLGGGGGGGGCQVLGWLAFLAQLDKLRDARLLKLNVLPATATLQDF